MSESRDHNIFSEATELQQEPTESDWLVLKEEVNVLMKRYHEIVHSLPADKNAGFARRNFMDIFNNLIGPVDLALQPIMAEKRSADEYYSGLKRVEALKKYFELIENNDDYRLKETAEKGLAFPSLDEKFRSDKQAVEVAGYRDYREAYIYESAKLLEAD